MEEKTFSFGNEIDWERFLKEIHEIIGRKIPDNAEKIEKKKTFPFFAYTIRLDPNGSIYIREIGHFGCFSNIYNSLKTDHHELRQLVDILEEDDNVRVVAELPGADKEQIDIIGTEKNLIIQPNRQKQNPSLNLDLPCPVNLENAKATLKNGVLEVVMKKGRSLPFKIKRIDVN